MPKQRILLGMSGGIDSTLAIKKLQDDGYEVVGLTLNISLHDNVPITKADKAKSLAAFFGIEHHIVDVSKDFKKAVIDYFTQEYLQGKTPSPCVRCNSKIKLKYLYELAHKYNCDKIATGHYVNVVKDNGIYYITKGVDKQKDQSYFLWNISQEILSKCVFPLGKLHKTEIIEQAKLLKLSQLSNTSESMSICFLRGGDYRKFLDEQLPDMRQKLQNGEVINSQGEIIGTHAGYPYYTIGQKRNLNLNEGVTGQYVAKIDAENNRLICASKSEIISNEIVCDNFHFNDPDFLASEQKVLIRIRGFDYQDPTPCTIYKNNNRLHIMPDEPLWAVTPGQPMVFYVEHKVVGGAVY